VKPPYIRGLGIAGALLSFTLRVLREREFIGAPVATFSDAA
jgi:hypothetical protein